MNDLIKIEKTKINGAEINSVNARDLHEFLNVKSDFATWIKRQLDGFFEDYDYIRLHKKVEANNATQIDYIVTLDVSKHIAMLQRSEEGQIVRKYFIEVEKQANKPMTIEQLLQENVKVIGQLQTKVITLQAKIETDKPKVKFAEAISGTTSNIDFETFAKALYDTEGLKYGRNSLMKWFRDNGYLMKNNKPYQTMLDRGLMTLKEGSYVNQATNELVTYIQPRISGKGQMYFTNKLLDEVQNGRA
jgi:anti-repressor protein